MAGTDIRYSNTSHLIDNSYYGNGCPNVWDASKPDDGYGGSPDSCSTRITKTYDNEDQKIGTYFDYQAASSGSGGTITTDNTIAPDTFCPLGWQLPYSGTGGDYYDQSRSWNFLFRIYNYEGNVAGTRGIQSYPLSYILAGYYALFLGGRLFDLGINTYTWSNTVQAGNQSYNLYISRTAYSQPKGTKGSDVPIRCSLILATLKSNQKQKLAEADFDIKVLVVCKNSWQYSS